MTRSLNRLSTLAIKSAREPGRYADGGNLYLSVTKTGSKSWVFMFVQHGKQREMGIGSVRDVPVTAAREAAALARRHLAEGRCPIVARDEARAAQRPAPLFGEIADELFRTLSPKWKNEKHRFQWEHALTVGAKALRKIPVDRITRDDVLRVLSPIWNEKPETAARLRNRIERVLAAAEAKGYRKGPNPARWKDNLDTGLGKRERLTRGHHKRVEIDAAPAFVAALREREAMAALALEFLILTAARTGEVLGATWGEIDRKARIWRIPAARMKAGKVHEVPLSGRASSVLEKVRAGREVSRDDPVFHGPKMSAPLSNMSLAMLMRRMGVAATPHGFRSTFRDWAGNRTNFPREVIEEALAHAVGSEVERAYRREADTLKRSKLLQAWAGFLDAPHRGEVLPFASGQARRRRGDEIP
jgi:integrase